MFDNGFGRRVAIFSGLVAVPLLMAVGLFGYSFHLGMIEGRARVSAQELDRERAEHLQSGISECSRAAQRTDQIRCIEDAVATSREDVRSERLLTAQVDASRWAFAAMIAAFLQLPISGFGLVMLLLTIREARRANEISHDFDRAWMKIEDCKMPVLVHRKDGDEIATSAFFEVFVSNVGNSPATEVFVTACVWRMPISQLPMLGNWLKRARAILADRGIPALGATTVIFPGEPARKIAFQTNPNEDRRLPFGQRFKLPLTGLSTQFACVCVFYRTQSGRQGVTLVPISIANPAGEGAMLEKLAGADGQLRITDAVITRLTAFDNAE